MVPNGPALAVPLESDMDCMFAPAAATASVASVKTDNLKGVTRAEK